MLLAVLLAILTLGMLPSRSSIETHTAGWASALALAQLAEVIAAVGRSWGWGPTEPAWCIGIHGITSGSFPAAVSYSWDLGVG